MVARTIDVCTNDGSIVHLVQSIVHNVTQQCYYDWWWSFLINPLPFVAPH